MSILTRIAEAYSASPGALRIFMTRDLARGYAAEVAPSAMAGSMWCMPGVTDEALAMIASQRSRVPTEQEIEASLDKWPTSSEGDAYCSFMGIPCCIDPTLPPDAIECRS